MDTYLETEALPEQQDFYYSLKQAELFQMLNQDDAYPSRIEKRTLLGKAYTCTVATGKSPTGIWGDYLLIGSGYTSDTTADGYW